MHCRLQWSKHSARQTAPHAPQTRPKFALFWADGAGTERRLRTTGTASLEIIAAQGNPLEENARLFALLNIALADAAICALGREGHFQLLAPGATAIAFAEPELNWMSVYCDTTLP